MKTTNTNTESAEEILTVENLRFDVIPLTIETFSTPGTGTIVGDRRQITAQTAESLGLPPERPDERVTF